MSRLGLLIATLAVISFGGCGRSDQIEERSPGERAFRRYCQTCHSLPRRDKPPAGGWESEIDNHDRRLKLDDSTKALIIEYLSASQ